MPLSIGYVHFEQILLLLKKNQPGICQTVLICINKKISTKASKKVFVQAIYASPYTVMLRYLKRTKRLITLVTKLCFPWVLCLFHDALD